jgi:translation initiation factor 6
MEAAKYRILGSDYVGVFATATEDYLFAGANLTSNSKEMMAKTLGVKCIDVTVSASDLVGLFVKANSNGVLVSNLMLDYEIENLKKNDLGLNVQVIESEINALGSNILANDKIAIINPDYSERYEKEIADVLDVEVIRAKIDGFKTVGANNILTNTGLVLNNRATAQEKNEWDRLTGFDSTLSTANTGALAIGLSVIANSKAVVAGDTTTGFELARIVEALE